MKSIAASVRVVTLAVLIGVLPRVTLANGGGDLPVAAELRLAATLSGPAARDLSWTALSGNVVVIDFWATTCAPCVGAIPHWNKLVEKFTDKPVKFVSITKEDKATIGKFLRRRPIRGYVCLDSDGATSAAYGVEGIPHTVIVNAQGRVMGVTSPLAVTEQVLHDALAGKPLSLVPPEAEADVVKASPADDGGALPLLELVVRRCSSDRRAVQVRPTKLDASGWSVRDVVAFVHDVHAGRVLVPETLSDRCYDVLVRWAEDGGVDPRQLLAQVLKPAFGVSATRTSREVEVYVLSAPVPADVRMTRNLVSGPTGYHTTTGDGVARATNRNMDEAARIFSSIVGRPVLNETGLEGGFDWELHFESESPTSLVEAVRKQLGLTVTESRRTVEFVVVEP